MKVYISADLEGVAGVHSLDHLSPEGREYDRARELMTGEVNAAIEGAFAAGATKVVVNDAHWGMGNLRVEDLDPRVRLISGRPKSLGMMAGMKGTFDAVVFIGYHPRMGTVAGVLDHSFSDLSIHRLWLGGEEVGELAFNAGLAGALGVPLVAVSGDALLSREIPPQVGPITVIGVKEGLGRTTAVSLHPAQARELIRRGVEEALRGRGKIRPWVFPGPSVLRVDFHTGAMAEVAALIPNVRRVEARAIEYDWDDYLEMYRLFQAILLLASTVSLK